MVNNLDNFSQVQSLPVRGEGGPGSAGEQGGEGGSGILQESGELESRPHPALLPGGHRESVQRYVYKKIIITAGGFRPTFAKSLKIRTA